MNVTALLNSSPEADVSTELEDVMRNPFRNRTPWDAGGYSLPIHTHQPGSSTDDALANDSPKENHTEHRGHKLSESHSSVSSFASFNSLSHSRLSSMSTVSSLQLPGQTISEGIYTDSDTSSHSSKTAAGSCSPVSPRTGRSISLSSSSPAFYSNSLASIAEFHFYGSPRKGSVDQIFLAAELTKMRPADYMDGVKEEMVSTNSARPSSPSDAVLIKRNTPPLIPRILTPPSVSEIDSSRSYFYTTIQEDAIQDSCSIQQSGRLSVQTRGHKRAVSAPDFPGTVADTLQGISEIPKSSQSTDEPISLSSRPDMSLIALKAASNTPLETASESFHDQRPCCMYISNCDTGSTLRKAVSHIFGRNKMCTRRIPEHIWVWYCRKHYQRARYRNAKEWARTLQYDLVSRQIRRLQDWSDENSRTGEGGIVEGYKLVVRKREQKRLDSKKPKEEREGSDSDLDETIESQGDASSSTAVPDWLLSLCGKNHDTGRIIEIIDGIQADLTENCLSAWPDIEILPNIIPGQNESGITKGYAKRRALPATHGRSQSAGSTAGPWTSQARLLPSDEQSNPGSLSQKRKRSDDREEEADIQIPPQNQRMRTSEWQVAITRQAEHTAQRPVFRNSDEHHRAGESLGSIEVRGEFHQSAAGANSLLLAAPRPHRYNPLTTAAYLDSGIPLHEVGSPSMPRGLHKRCHSDMDALDSCEVSSRISAKHRHQSAGSVQYDRLAPRRLFSPPAFCRSLTCTQIPKEHQRKHARHQSTPNVPPLIQYPLFPSADCRTLPELSPAVPFSSLNMTDSVRSLDLRSRKR